MRDVRNKDGEYFFKKFNVILWLFMPCGFAKRDFVIPALSDLSLILLQLYPSCAALCHPVQSVSIL